MLATSPNHRPQPPPSTTSYAKAPTASGKPGQHTLEDDDDELDLLAELDAVENQMVDWKKVFSWRAWVRWKMVPYYILVAIIGVLVILMTLYHKEIIAWLKPVAAWMKALPAGWTIPIAVMLVISFPPLFGHEIVAILCGVVWGLWVGFGIVAAGTFLGEMANFFCFKYWFRSHAEKLERKDIMYACLAQAVRDGGFWLALVARLSAIPGHFTTVVFSTCGMGAGEFALGAVLSMPKQLITVYLGVALDNVNADQKTKIMEKVVLVITFLITVAAAWWIWRKMKQARPTVVRERRRRQKLLALGGTDAVGEVERVEMDALRGEGRFSEEEAHDFGREEAGMGRTTQIDPYLPRTSDDYTRRPHHHPTGPNSHPPNPYQPSAQPFSTPYEPPRPQQAFAYPEPRLNDYAGQGLQSQQQAAAARFHQLGEHGQEPLSYHSAQTLYAPAGGAGHRPHTAMLETDLSDTPSYTTFVGPHDEGTPTQSDYAGATQGQGQQVDARYAPLAKGSLGRRF